MQHTCQDCDHKFVDAGQSQDSISPAVQCPNCHSYRTQPSGVPDAIQPGNPSQPGQDMPTSTTPDASGNSLREGILAGMAERCRFCNGPLDPHGQCASCDLGLEDQVAPQHNDFQMDGVALQAGDPPDGGWKNRGVRDESFSHVKRADFPSLFEGPEFETTGLVAPPDLYRHALESEAAHRHGIQMPHGVTDNLHATLGNLGAWVENPYENGQLRPYNQYWGVIRPERMQPGPLQVGVADPTMAEIINHVAQTDDLTPLYEYRGRQSHVKTAGPAMALLPEAGAALLGGGADAAAGAAAADAAAGAAAGGEAAASAGAAEAAGGAASAAEATGVDPALGVGNQLTLPGLEQLQQQVPADVGGVGGLMGRVMGQGAVGKGLQFGTGQELAKGIAGPIMNYADDFLGMGTPSAGGGGGGGGMPVQDASFYSRRASEDDAFPDSHDEIPKNEDGDHKQQDDGNSHEWQRDISVNGVGGTEHSPGFNPAGPAFQRFMMLLPLLGQLLQSGEDASQDPLVQGLHQSLESEIPGYLDHGDHEAGERLLMILAPKGGKGGEDVPDEEPTHTDENSGGAHESKVAHLNGDVSEFLPDLIVTPPHLQARTGFMHDISNGEIPGPLYPEEQMLDSRNWPKSGPTTCPHCGHYGTTGLGLCAGCGQEIIPFNKTADTQGPQTPEQIQAVQKWILEHAQELQLQGQELTDTILSVPTNPLQFADVLAKIQQSEPPPAPPEDAGMSAGPPQPAVESAPPGATMPVPGMEQQMMSAIQRHAADSIAGKCPNCGGHTTELIDGETGKSRCHGCNTSFVTKGESDNVHPGNTTASTWNVDRDLRKEAEAGSGSHDFDLDTGSPIEGVPIADQQGQRDIREEQDTGHTWTDEDGNPLKVGEEYEMYSEKYDIPDLVRIEAVKPNAVVYTLTGEFGLEHSTELTKEEANIERVSFRSTTQEGELGVDDSFEENNDDNTGYQGEPERHDMSAPSGLVSASVIKSGVTSQANPALAWLNPHTAGANYTAMEQRALIDERGTARNADLLDLTGTHYITDAEEDHFLFGI